MINELIPMTKQQPGVVLLENYDELKKYLNIQLEQYRNIAYSEDSIKDAKADRASLRKVKKSISDKRKEIKAIYLEPYLTVEEKLKELEGLVQEPIDLIDGFVKESEQKEKSKKSCEIKAFYAHHSTSLGNLADSVFASKGFFEDKWLNASCKAVTWQAEIKEKIVNVSKDIHTIQNVGGQYTSVLITKYLETLSMDKTIELHKKLTESDSFSEVSIADDDDNVVGYKILKINATARQMSELINHLEMLDVDYEELENGMPVEQTELFKPDFDSFVAFDIETSGSFGAGNGDAPAEITEIGAVKVINGKITDRFDRLCNPGRKIVPRIARLTNITDEMVANEPSVSEIIKEFSEYIGDLPLVGHNIKSSDLHYIEKAAKKAGVAIENPFFDTYG